MQEDNRNLVDESFMKPKKIKTIVKKKAISSKRDFYARIREIVGQARSNAYRSVNFIMVEAYWNVGRLIVEEEQGGQKRAAYGEAVLAELSIRLSGEFGKGFDLTNLRKMRQFYLMFSKRGAVRLEFAKSKKQDSLRPELSWTHYRLLLRIEDEKARTWYMNEAADQNWSSRQMERQINSFYYQRLLASKNKTTVVKEAKEKLSQLEPEQFIRDPYVLEFLNLKDYPGLRESNLEKSIIDNLQNFLLELGKGFSFVARQKRMRFEEDDFYADLVFYNYILKCFVLIDLKIGKLTHQDIGQMDSYVRMFEENCRGENDNPTIGLILCSKKNEAIAKYSVLKDSKRIFASKYKLYLPTEEEWQKELEQERSLIEQKKISLQGKDS